MKLIMLIFLGIYGFINLVFFILCLFVTSQTEDLDLFPTIGCVIFPFSALGKISAIILIKFSDFLSTPLKKKEKKLVYDYRNFGFIKQGTKFFSGLKYFDMLVGHNCKKGDLWK